MRKPIFTVSNQCHRKGPWLQNSDLHNKSDCTIYVAKTKVLISCALTRQLICTFVSHMQQILSKYKKTNVLISCAVTTQMICTFVLHMQQNKFSHDTAHLCIICSRELLHPQPVERKLCLLQQYQHYLLTQCHQS